MVEIAYNAIFRINNLNNIVVFSFVQYRLNAALLYSH